MFPQINIWVLAHAYKNNHALTTKGYRAIPSTAETVPTQGMVKMIILVVIEHVFVVFKIFIDLFVRDEPYWVSQKQAKIEFQRRRNRAVKDPRRIMLNALKRTNRLEPKDAANEIKHAIEKSRAWVAEKDKFIAKHQQRELKVRKDTLKLSQPSSIESQDDDVINPPKP